MEIDFQSKMADKSDEELLKYIEQTEKYVPAAIAAAIEELERRKGSLSEEVQYKIASGLERKRRQQAEEAGFVLRASDNGDLIDWGQAPRYYTQEAIFFCSALLSTLWGAILLAIDLWKEHRTGAFISLASGLAYTILTFYSVRAVPEYKAGLYLLMNMAGGMLLTSVLRPKYIPKDAVYIKRAPWIILAVVLGFILLNFLLMFLLKGFA
jgi:hypothetical protein